MQLPFECPQIASMKQALSDLSNGSSLQGLLRIQRDHKRWLLRLDKTGPAFGGKHQDGMSSRRGIATAVASRCRGGGWSYSDDDACC